MDIDIVMCDLHDFALFAQIHRLLGQAVSSATTGFDLHEDQVLCMFGYQVDLAVAATEIAFQDSIPQAEQFFSGQAFSQATEALTCGCSSVALRRCIYWAPLLLLYLIYVSLPVCVVI